MYSADWPNNFMKELAQRVKVSPSSLSSTSTTSSFRPVLDLCRGCSECFTFTPVLTQLTLSPVEIMNTAIRAKATAITTMASWLANFMIGQVSPIAFKNIGEYLFVLFG